jgi:nucleotide-binding universal stress UspA family protein
MAVILVPAGGGESDAAVFETALTAARPLSAHLRFFHVRVRPGEAVEHTPHAEFAIGPAVCNELDRLQSQSELRARAALRHVEEFCGISEVRIGNSTDASGSVSASWCEEEGPSMELLMRKARHCDFVVMGRQTKPNGLRSDCLEQLLLGCGRPIVVAPRQPPTTLIGTAMVCWRESAEAVRAVAAAMPYLRRSRRVLLVSIADAPGKGTTDLAEYLGWHGVRPEVRQLSRNSGSTAELLAAVAQDDRADLLVMGAYGHSRVREIIFGGCTQAFIRSAEVPVLFAH